MAIYDPLTSITSPGVQKSISKQELEVLAKTIAGEIDPRQSPYGTDANRQEVANILETIATRAALSGKSFADVATEKNSRGVHQYSTWNEGRSRRNMESNFSKFGGDITKAVNDYFTGKLQPTHKGLTNYYSPSGMLPRFTEPGWARTLDRREAPKTQVGPHIFYADMDRLGARPRQTGQTVDALFSGNLPRARPAEFAGNMPRARPADQFVGNLPQSRDLAMQNLREAQRAAALSGMPATMTARQFAEAWNPIEAQKSEQRMTRQAPQAPQMIAGFGEPVTPRQVQTTRVTALSPSQRLVDDAAAKRAAGFDQLAAARRANPQIATAPSIPQARPQQAPAPAPTVAPPAVPTPPKPGGGWSFGGMLDTVGNAIKKAEEKVTPIIDQSAAGMKMLSNPVVRGILEMATRPSPLEATKGAANPKEFWSAFTGAGGIPGSQMGDRAAYLAAKSFMGSGPQAVTVQGGGQANAPSQAGGVPSWASGFNTFNSGGGTYVELPNGNIIKA